MGLIEQAHREFGYDPYHNVNTAIYDHIRIKKGDIFEVPLPAHPSISSVRMFCESSVDFAYKLVRLNQRPPQKEDVFEEDKPEITAADAMPPSSVFVFNSDGTAHFYLTPGLSKKTGMSAAGGAPAPEAYSYLLDTFQKLHDQDPVRFADARSLMTLLIEETHVLAS